MYRVQNDSDSGCPVKCFNVSGRCETPEEKENIDNIIDSINNEEITKVKIDKNNLTSDNLYHKDIKTMFTFDKGNWCWCKNIGTAKHFSCTKTITPEMVKKKIALVEKHIKLKIDTVLDSDGNLTNKKTGELICKLGE